MIDFGKITQFFKSLYTRLVKIHDTPQKIALGFGLGVFLGIVPGVGPIASVVLAGLFRINIAAALLGSLLTNTWTNIVMFALAIKTGSFITGANWKDVQRDWGTLAKNSDWLDLLKLSALKVLVPLIIGYFIIALIMAILAYVITLVAIKGINRKSTEQI